jgi:hypothetical protein
MTAVDAVFNRAQELTSEQRIEFFHRLEESLLDAGLELDIEPSERVKNMLEERLRSWDANPGGGVPFEQAVAAIRKRWNK